MKRHTSRYSSAIGKDVWRELEHVISLGQSPDTVFSDWLDLILDAHLSLTDNLTRGNKVPFQFDGVYETRYLETIGRYASNRPVGERPADYFVKAAGLLFRETAERQTDVLGTIYEERITFGEHGQYFTPMPIANLLASILVDDPGSIADPAGCGSGRLLLAAGLTHPNSVLRGIDVDRRCARMATLNMMMFGFNAAIIWGDGLSGKAHCESASN